jgi:plasmid stabilization system protein ParE
MTKPLKIAPWVVPKDLQAIYDYHRQFSLAKAERIVAEYDRVLALLEVNPLLFHERDGGWRVYAFDSGTYLLYYKELESLWLVAGVFHARRSPAWIREQLLIRLVPPKTMPAAK